VIDSKDIDAQRCGSDQLRKQILAADFNGDGIVDYAILLRLGKPQKGGLRWNPAIEGPGFNRAGGILGTK